MRERERGGFVRLSPESLRRVLVVIDHGGKGEPKPVTRSSVGIGEGAFLHWRVVWVVWVGQRDCDRWG